MSDYLKKEIIGGSEWRWIYLETSTLMTDEQRDQFAREAIKFYSEGKGRKRNVKGDGFEGYIEAGKWCALGTFSGKQYIGHIETDRGKSQLSILLDFKRMHPIDN